MTYRVLGRLHKRRREHTIALQKSSRLNPNNREYAVYPAYSQVFHDLIRDDPDLIVAEQYAISPVMYRKVAGRLESIPADDSEEEDFSGDETEESDGYQTEDDPDSDSEADDDPEQR